MSELEAGTRPGRAQVLLSHVRGGCRGGGGLKKMCPLPHLGGGCGWLGVSNSGRRAAVNHP